MSWPSIIAIYFLFFVAVAFLMLPFGMRTDEEVGAPKVPGQAESAPHRFELVRHLLKAAGVAMLVFALYYANYVNGWITVEQLDWYH
jgi:predicted secreted protein